MVNHSIAAGCRNTYREDVSLFKFPKESVLQWKWVEQVQRTKARCYEHYVLCSDHFDISCFELDSELALQEAKGWNLMPSLLCLRDPVVSLLPTLWFALSGFRGRSNTRLFQKRHQAVTVKAQLSELWLSEHSIIWTLRFGPCINVRINKQGWLSELFIIQTFCLIPASQRVWIMEVAL